MEVRSLMMSHKVEYKNTEIGRIPKEWEVVRLGEVLALKNGERPSASENGIFPIYGANGIMGHTSNFLMDNDFTIIIGRVGASGEVHLGMRKIWISDNAIYNDNYDKNRVYIPFVYYLLKFKKLSQFASKSTHPIISQSFLNLFLISLPPLPEQQRLAEILSTVDQAIERVDEVIAKTERVKKGLMQEVLTKGIGHKSFKDTEIGRVPKEWKVVRLKDMGKVATGKTPSTSNNIYWNGNIPFITPADMKEGKYIYKTERYVTSQGARQVGNVLQKDSVLVVCIGSTIGKMGITYTESVTNQQINAIICNDEANAHYIYYVITFRSEFLKSFSGVAAVPIIKKSLFELLKLPFPPLPEQEKIAEILSTVDARLELLREKKEKLGRVKKGLMNDLLTGKRRVKI